jgi:hypothetical protein
MVFCSDHGPCHDSEEALVKSDLFLAQGIETSEELAGLINR